MSFINNEIDFLTEQLKEKINIVLLKFPNNKKRSAVLLSLRIVQDANGGFLSDKLIAIVADYLLVPQIFVYEVAFFYSMYNLKNQIRNKICICTNLTCFLYGSVDLVNVIKNRYNLDENNVSGNGSFFLSEIGCLSLCDKAPVLQIGKCYYFNVTKEIVFKLLDSFEV